MALSAQQRAFLAAYPITGTIGHAAEAAGISRRSHINWIRQPEYAEAFAAAKDAFVESLEAEVARRARDGVEEPVYQGGKLVGTISKKSDTLAIFLLKANRPDKYRDEIRVITDTEVDAELRRLSAQVAAQPPQTVAQDA